ncbi:uncharacterized protein LOC105781473 [Gossypium raimondii]|uniref:uncharacterized protein LOC105781473 n=1 Tax=Gossypium raimondii TaxID=29730 RepID=UPI00063A9C38|nr:uncharacterized protein LOC105781473 [Gossypium raimondii]
MSEWFTEFVRTNLVTQQPPLPLTPQPILVIPQGMEPIQVSKPPVDKIRKSYQSVLKKSKQHHNRSTASVGYSSRDRGTRRSSPKPQATSVASMGSVRDFWLECKHCKKPHYGECRLKNIACFRCGSLNRYFRNCPEKSEKEKAQTTRSSNIAARGRPPRNLENMSGSCDVKKNSTMRSEARALVRLMLFVHARMLMHQMLLPGYSFSADLILIPFDEFDVILGIDWLTLHDATKYVRKGCNAYIAYVLNTKASKSKLKSVPVVCEYPDVFPEKLPGLPPMTEVEFAIKLVLEASPILIAPYRMALAELKELKAQQ